MPEDLPRLTRQAQQAWAAIDHSRELVAQANALTVRLAETLEYCQYCAGTRVLYGLWGESGCSTGRSIPTLAAVADHDPIWTRFLRHSPQLDARPVGGLL